MMLTDLAIKLIIKKNSSNPTKINVIDKAGSLQVGELKTRNHIRTLIQFEINSNLTFAEIERETDDLPSN